MIKMIIAIRIKMINKNENKNDHENGNDKW